MLGEALALSSALLFGLSTVLIKTVVPRVDSITVTAVRLITGAVFAVLVSALLGQFNEFSNISKDSLLILLVAGGVVMTGHITWIKAIGIDDVSRIFPTMTGLYILMSVVFSVLLTDDVFSFKIILGAVIVLLGIYLLSYETNSYPGNSGEISVGSKFIALGLAAFTALSWTFGILTMDLVVNTVDPLLATSVRMSFMSLLMVIIAGSKLRYIFKIVTREDTLALLAGGILTGISTMTFISALKWSTPSIVVILNCTAPFFVVPIAFIWLKEKITKATIIGTVACFLGVVLTLS